MIGWRWAARWLGVGVLLLSLCGTGMKAGGSTLSMTELLKMARERGPGYVEASWVETGQALAEREQNAQYWPQLHFTGHQQMLPEPSTVAGASLQWDFSDELALVVNVPLVKGDTSNSRPGSPARSPSSFDSASLTWSSQIWPRSPGEVNSAGVKKLQVREAYFQADYELLKAVFEYQLARTEAELARLQTVLYEHMASVDLLRYENDELGLAELQSTQDRLRESKEYLRQSLRRLEAAERELSWLLGEQDSDTLLFSGEISDDLGWDNLLARLTTGLGTESQQESLLKMLPATWEWLWSTVDAISCQERALQYSLSYQQAKLNLARAENRVRAEKQNWYPKIQAEATIQTEFGGGTIDYGLGVDVVWDGGMGNVVAAEQATVTREKAAAALEEAQQAVIDAAEAGQEDVYDALCRLAAARVDVSGAEDVLAIAKKRVEAGFATKTEVDMARLELGRAKMRLQQAGVDLKLAFLRLAHQLGFGL